MRWYKHKGVTSSILLLLSTLSTSKLLPLESSSTNGSRARFIPTLVVSSALRNTVRLGGRLRYRLYSSSYSTVRLGGRLCYRLRVVVVACSAAPLYYPLRSISYSNVRLSPRLRYRPRISTDYYKVATYTVN